MYEENHNFLKHYGVLGMHWGRRQFGTETALSGKKRSSPSIKQLGATKGILTNVSSVSEAGKRAANLIEKTTKKKTDLSKISDDELRKRVSRLGLEQQYRSLSSVDKSKGAELARNILEGVGTVVTIGASVASIYMAIKTAKDGG